MSSLLPTGFIPSLTDCQHLSQISGEGLTMTIIHRLQVHIVTAKGCYSPAVGLSKQINVPDWPTLMVEF